MSFGALRFSGRVRELKSIVVTTCLIIMILALAGCGFLPFGKQKPLQEAVPPPSASQSISGNIIDTEDSHTEIVSDTEDFVQVPAREMPREQMDPLIAVGPLQLGSEGSMGALGLNLETYFDDTGDPPERLKKLERAVISIQRDLRTLAPPIQRLITVERDIQALISQLGELTQGLPPPPADTQTGYSDASPPSASLSTPTPIPIYGGTGGAASPPIRSEEPDSNSGLSYSQAPAGGVDTIIFALRIGEHADVTRLVFDVNAPTSYHYDLDNEENLLVIEFPDADWKGSGQWHSDKSPLIASYNVDTLNDRKKGSRIVLQLKKATSVRYETVIKPENNKNYRIVLDLKK